MGELLDLRGLSCPIPLIKTRDALTVVDQVTILVDEPGARENIMKFARAQRYDVQCDQGEEADTIIITKV